MRDLDRFRGCLLAGAAGDALGYPVEFTSAASMRTQYGKNGITEYDLWDGLARISDDTQMTLFTANGLLLGTTRGMTRGIMAPYQDYVGYCYKDWYRTQTERYPLDGYRYSWLSDVPGLFSRRAPGNTCLSALAGGVPGSTEKPVNSSKGCGGVMRVAPVGLYFCDSPRVSIEESDRIAAEAAAITHGHELGWLPAAALAHIVRRLAEEPGETVPGAVKDSMEALGRLWPDAAYLEDMLGIMRQAVELAASDVHDYEAICRLGGGWTGEETLAISVFCALRSPEDIEKALIAAVNHDGDSDSTGAVTGNILGAALGAGAIPAKFLEKLEHREVITELADDLYNDCKMGEHGENPDPVWEAKYVKKTWPGKK
jgi:ADP-ribosylglycohydrolase